ncbi:hypothetical protein CBS101457_003377 [Exobasidium rhododendri]|nr:hypothetical protein CBS101457_003377 [Exobasidium rhododendri]
MAEDNVVPISINSAVSTPGSERSEDDGGIVSNTTITTELISRKTDKKVEQESFTLTHTGIRGISHQVDSDGTIHLRPTSNRKGRKIRGLVSFRARESHFDRHNKDIAKDPFRGFYTLFWIGLFILMLNTFYTSFATTGQIISLTFATLFSKDAIVLAISDGALVASTFVCVPFAWVLKKGWTRYWPTLIWVQHTWQALLLAAVIKWTRHRDWPWVQSGFFVLHTLSMMMKIHSYMAINGYMADLYYRMKRLEGMIEERVAEVEKDEADGGKGGKGGKGGGIFVGVTEKAWQRAVKRARVAEDEEKERRKVKVNAIDTLAGEVELPVSKASKPEYTEEKWNSLPAQRGTSILRQRANASIVERRTSVKKTSEVVEKATRKSDDPNEVVIRDPHPLATHPDQLISELSREVENIREDLTSSPSNITTTAEGVEREVYTKTVTWPSNITFANFWDYLLIPTLVYELSYPRTKAIRPLYLLEKALATFGTFFVIYVITEHWIMPHQPDPSTPLLRTFLELAVPMMINYLLIFFIMFECICQWFAELTCFADRLFYEDWWNATSMDVFSRRWNRPVHSFLLRHVYASSITVGVSRSGAIFVTFLLSSLLHELVMAIVSGKIRGYLFAMQMAQLPLIALGQIPFVKRNETVGNVIFWTGLLIGFPMLNIAYITY